MQKAVSAGTSNASMSNAMLLALISIVGPHSPPPDGGGVSPGAQGRDVGVEVAARHGLDDEGHVGVRGAAELGALAGVGPRLGDRELELVRRPLLAEVDEVALDEELRARRTRGSRRSEFSTRRTGSPTGTARTGGSPPCG